MHCDGDGLSLPLRQAASCAFLHCCGASVHLHARAGTLGQFTAGDSLERRKDSRHVQRSRNGRGLVVEDNVPLRYK